MEILRSCIEVDEIFGFLRIEPLRSFEELRGIIRGKRILNTNVVGYIGKFLDNLEEYEESCKRKYKLRDCGNKYEARYGYIINCLLPKGNYSEQELKAIVSRFYKYIVGKEKGIKYISFKVIKNQAKYLMFYFTDREYYFHKKICKYTKDIYIHKYTKNFVNKSDEMAILKHKKGDFKLDESGKKIIKLLKFKETKSRIFIYTDDQKTTFKNMLLNLFLQAVAKVKVKVEITFGRFFKRMNLSNANNRFLRRIIIANNKMMQYIQNILNLKIRSCYRYVNGYEAFKFGVSLNEIVPTKDMDIFVKLFEKYQEIFRKGVFELDNIKFKIKNIRCDEVEKNLMKLKKMFDIEFQTTISFLNS